MSCVEENWQTTRPTIRERSKFIFNNDLFSDVKFVVRKMDGESESKQVIPAHKFVLSISSPVFEAMFYGELAETRDSIELPDCEYESLLELFRYMYSDEVNLSGSTVMGVLYLAKKYMVPSLADKCTEYLQDNLDATNVFNILPSAQKYVEKNLTERCWEVIDEQTEEAVKSDGFTTIDRSLLEAMVKRDTLTIEEIDLFKAVHLWATRECARQGLAGDGEVKRRILGEEVVKKIRFPVMTLNEFAKDVLDCMILTRDEAFGIVKYFGSCLDTQVGFPEIRRDGRITPVGKFERCCRFGSINNINSGFSYSGDKRDCLLFQVDKDILLHGVVLCGSKNEGYSVTVQIIDLDDRERFVAKAAGRFRSTCGSESFYGFPILFHSPIIIVKNKLYRVEALISGANSCFVQNGRNRMLCSGVKFEFKHSGKSTNGTNVEKGQFPEFLFTVK